MTLDLEQKALFIIFEALAYRGRQASSVGAALSTRLMSAAATYREWEPRDVTKLFESRDDSGEFPENTTIRLKPPNHQSTCIAMLRCKWDFSDFRRRCRFYYGLWYMFKPPPATAAQVASTVPAFIGYRFETPEQGLDHNYFHCQPCLNMGPATAVIPHALQRCHHNPTWPMPAANSVQLLLCMTLSLYGLKEFDEFASEVLQTRDGQKNTFLVDGIRHVQSLGVRT